MVHMFQTLQVSGQVIHYGNAQRPHSLRGVRPTSSAAVQATVGVSFVLLKREERTAQRRQSRPRQFSLLTVARIGDRGVGTASSQLVRRRRSRRKAAARQLLSARHVCQVFQTNVPCPTQHHLSATGSGQCAAKRRHARNFARPCRPPVLKQEGTAAPTRTSSNCVSGQSRPASAGRIISLHIKHREVHNVGLVSREELLPPD